MSDEKNLSVKEENYLQEQDIKPRGFEDETDEDILLPRIKLIQDLSPENKEKIADSGSLINSLTKEVIADKRFVPVFKFTNHIKWKDRSAGGGMVCRSMDGKTGTFLLDNTVWRCFEECGQTEFDNSKEGKESHPLCTKYINFLGFLENEQYPIVASFCRTYLNEGKRLYSIAKFTMQDMWKHGYYLKSKLMSKNDNQWYILTVMPGGKMSDENIEFGNRLFDMFRGKDIKVDVEEAVEYEDDTGQIDADVADEV